MQYNSAFICSFFCLAAMASVPPPPAGQTLQPSPLDLETLKPDPRDKLSKLPIVIVISLGGLSIGKVDSRLTPNLNVFRTKYASANFLIPVFPTKTSVNHFSIATGLYAGEHGVLYDCKFDETPGHPCEYEQYNQKLKPIWIENQMNGGVSGVLNWPGSDQEYLGQKPVHRIGPGEECKDPLGQMIEWLEHKTQPANLLMAYFSEIDQMNHQNSPYRIKVQNEIKRMDALVKNFIDKLEEKTIKQYIDIIIIGTQGIGNVINKKGINLNSILNNDAIPNKSMGANAIISPKTKDEYADAYTNLKRQENTYDINKEVKQYRVYKSYEIPENWHLKASLFEEKLFVVANYGYFFWNDYLYKIKANQKAKYENKCNYDPDEFEVGMDGYDVNQSNWMMTLFIGIGPNFEPRSAVKYFFTIDIHQLLRKILHLEGVISDSQTLLSDRIRPLLRDLVSTPMEEIERKIDIGNADIVQIKNKKKIKPKYGKCLSRLFGRP